MEFPQKALSIDELYPLPNDWYVRCKDLPLEGELIKCLHFVNIGLYFSSHELDEKYYTSIWINKNRHIKKVFRTFNQNTWNIIQKLFIPKGIEIKKQQNGFIARII
jgi:hypothetical protein